MKKKAKKKSFSLKKLESFELSNALQELKSQSKKKKVKLFGGYNNV